MPSPVLGSGVTAHPLFTQEWAEAYREELNANEDYAEAGSDWEWPLAMMVRADPEQGFDEDRAVVLDLYQGECRGVDVVEGEEASEAAEFVISGSLSTWYDVLDGQLRPLKALMFGKLKLEQGKLRELVPYTRASKEMVESAQEVPTQR